MDSGSSKPGAEGTTVSEAASRRARGRPRLEEVVSIEGELLEGALRLFVQYGYGATTMTAIAQSMQISKTTLYSRFPTKEALFRAIIETQIGRVANRSGFQEAEARSLGLAEGLEQYVARMLEVSLHPEQLEIDWLILSEARRFPELGAAAIERTRASVAQVAEFIREQAHQEGIPCSNPVAVAETLLQSIRGWFLAAMLAVNKPSLDEQVEWAKRTIGMLIASRAVW